MCGSSLQLEVQAHTLLLGCHGRRGNLLRVMKALVCQKRPVMLALQDMLHWLDLAPGSPQLLPEPHWDWQCCFTPSFSRWFNLKMLKILIKIELYLIFIYLFILIGTV